MRILMIGAHPDDCEFECSGLAAKYAKDGHVVQMLSLCNGCFGHHEMGPQAIAERRYGETQAAAEFLGVKYDIWQDSNDCELICDLETRARLVKYIRRFNPDIVFCHRTNDYHADHRNAGMLLQDASYLLIVPNYCSEEPAMPKMPIIMHYGDYFKNPPFVPDVVISIDDVIDKKLKMLDFHVSQVYEWLPYTYGTLEQVPPATDPKARFDFLCGDEVTADTPDELILNDQLKGQRPEFAKRAFLYRKDLIRRYGEEKGKKVVFAEAFCVCEYGSPLTEEAKQVFFPY